MKARGVTSVLAVALAGLASAQLDDAALKVKVTIDCPAANARKVVQDLAKVSKVKLATTLTKDTLFLHVVDVPLSEVMDRIAAATHATWQLSGGAYRLTRSQKVEKEEADAEYKVFFEAVKEAVKKYVADSVPNSSSAKIGVYWAVQRVLPKLIARLDPHILADMQENERLVFSSLPNRMQRPLGVTLEEYSKLVADDCNLYKIQGAADYKPEMFTSWLERFPYNEPAQEPGSRQPKVTLAIWRNGSGFFIYLRHYSSRGHVLLPSFSSMNTETRGPVFNEPLPSSPGPNGKLEISDEAKEFGLWFLKGSREAPISKSVFDKLLRPDVYDPFSLQVSACLLAVAKVKNVNLIANIPDSFDPVHEIYGYELPETINGYLGELKRDRNLKVTTDDSWISITPMNPSAERSWYVDRASMAKLFQSCRDGQAKLWDLGDYAVANNFGNWAAADNPYLLLFCPNTFSMGEKTLDWEMLRFYGGLGATDRKAFENGMTIRYSALNPNLRQLASQMVYWGQPRIEFDSPDETSLGTTLVATWRSDPTELAPDGLPSVGAFRVKVRNGHALAYALDSQATQFGSMSPEYYGHQAWREEDAGGDWKQTKLRLGTRKTYECDFQLAADARISKILTEDSFSANGALKTWGDLPDDLKKTVEEALAAERKRIDEIRNRPKNVPPAN